jgi:hypothetical protein
MGMNENIQRVVSEEQDIPGLMSSSGFMPHSF